MISWCEASGEPDVTAPPADAARFEQIATDGSSLVAVVGPSSMSSSASGNRPWPLGPSPRCGRRARPLRAAGVPVLHAPRREPWGLVEMWVADPDGLPLALVEIPEDHPLRRDHRDRR